MTCVHYFNTVFSHTYIHTYIHACKFPVYIVYVVCINHIIYNYFIIVCIYNICYFDVSLANFILIYSRLTPLTQSTGKWQLQLSAFFKAQNEWPMLLQLHYLRQSHPLQLQDQI